MHIERLLSAPEIESLLAQAHLPTADVRGSSCISFLGVRSNGQLVGTAGIEQLSSEIGLLRSVAISPSFQRLGLASNLVSACEQEAKHKGIHVLYLLTSGASTFFENLGYLAIARTSAPVEVAATAQFRSLCSHTATLMHKVIQ